MMSKPDLLYIAPVVPAPSGNGLAMRAAMVLDALARDFAVHLLVVSPFGRAEGVSRFVRERTAQAVIEPIGPDDDPLPAADVDAARTMAMLLALPQPLPCRFATARRRARLAERFAGLVFDVVHVMRLYMVPYAAPFLDPAYPPVAVLDLDDDEVRTHERIAALHAQSGDLGTARVEAREAERYADLERAWSGRFDRVLVCSEADRARLSERFDPERLALLPNAIALPRAPADRPAPAEPRRLLFVGTLGYFANQDAAQHLCRDVLPILRAQARVSVEIVGRNPGPVVLALSRLPGVTVRADVPEVGPYYRDAELVMMPLRAGGGTRIKLLEALAHAKPVVSTAIGAEGIAVENRRHLLIADGAEAFAAACLELLNDPAFARSLGRHGRARVRQRYTPEVAAAHLARAYQALYDHHATGRKRGAHP